MLEVRNLSVGIATPSGPLALVEEVDFRLEAGRTLGIVGESGSGKSMLALALMGLLPPAARASGSIRLEGDELIGLPEAALCRIRGKRIGMIFQEPMTALNPAMTVGEQIAEGVQWHENLGRRAARARALDLLQRVGIPEAARRLDDYPHQMSGGQRQRVGIAIALACRPRLLIADEPTTALDVTVQAQILDLLRELVAEMGMGLILISHDLGVIAETADDTLVMYAGMPVETGSSAAIFARPAHPYTRGLFLAMPGHAGVPAGAGQRLQTIPGSVPEPGRRPSGCRFADRCAYVIEACRAAVPPWEPLPGGQQARCIRLEELP
ncbi:ABC transporter ATP-binding protein [Aquibaculum arenosum]|uniref:ABC transporter ATP-binding protein n=1 Tax=Aquibaculum arenosum TaxID=3032591 RepID=A0ABT5YQJ1_9PROT|nr:ABC transporter ATP-binding protein [Fodinicurvata sp. CAU 1616]MDF2097236.1 ABC transporter ATP-binding protein [Fodinicurvata sp. CAU 1616]